MKNKNSKILLILAFLLPFEFLFVKLIAPGSKFIKLYNSNFYYFSKLRIDFFSLFKFSIGDILYLLSFILLTYHIFYRWDHYKRGYYNIFLHITSGISILYLFFQLSWGLNYQAESLESKLNIDKSYSDSDLEKVVSYLILKTNNLHRQLSKHDTLPIEFPFDKKQARILLANEKYNIVKNSIWSTSLSYMGYAGYLNPFTLEAQVNAKIPMISYLTTIAHEQSHQKGVAAENESNYWAFKNTSTNKNPYVKYAGYSFALRYCMSNLYKRNSKKARILSEEIFPGVKKNFNDINEFWKKYQNPFEPIFKKTYDKFLKINNQKSGIESYNEMVSLVIFDLKNDINSQKK